MPAKLTTEEFIRRARLIYGDKYGYTKVVYTYNHTKVIIVCFKHGDFEITPADFLSGHACWKCSGDRSREYYKEQRKKKYFSYQEASEFCIKNQITTATQFRDFYKKNKPKSLPFNPDIMYEEWTNWQTFLDTFNISKKHYKSNNNFVERAKEVHGDTYGYDKSVFTGTENKLIITCFEHGDFPQTPFTHLNGCGCPKCGYKTMADKTRKPLEIFIREASEKHNNKYGYDNVEYLNANTNVFITCFEHGDFPQKPSSHLYGRGCPKCARSKRSANFLSYDEAKIFIKNLKLKDKRDYWKWWRINRPNFLPFAADVYYSKHK